MGVFCLFYKLVGIQTVYPCSPTYAGIKLGGEDNEWAM
jgi:hypothetical protein